MPKMPKKPSLRELIPDIKYLLTQTNLSIEAVCRRVGTYSDAYSEAVFLKEVGMSMAEYRLRYRPETLPPYHVIYTQPVTIPLNHSQDWVHIYELVDTQQSLDVITSFDLPKLVITVDGETHKISPPTNPFKSKHIEIGSLKLEFELNFQQPSAVFFYRLKSTTHNVNELNARLQVDITYNENLHQLNPLSDQEQYDNADYFYRQLSKEVNFTLTTRMINVLKIHDIYNEEALLNVTALELLKLPNLGKLGVSYVLAFRECLKMAREAPPKNPETLLYKRMERANKLLSDKRGYYNLAGQQIIQQTLLTYDRLKRES